MISFGEWRARVAPWTGIGLVIEWLDGPGPTPADYVNEVLLVAEHREAFFALVDRVGLVVCESVGGDDSRHRGVRGRSSRGRLSQGEYFHHDGCSGPTKPRVVEIRCPYQEIPRHTFTAIAPFPEVVIAMVCEMPAMLRTPDLVTVHDDVLANTVDVATDWALVQGSVNRAVRRALPAESQREFLRQVDVRIGAYREPWKMGESRFIANANASRTMQHRRAYLEPHAGKRPNGHLVKRWPAGPELEELDDEDGCAVPDAAMIIAGGVEPRRSLARCEPDAHRG
ncbi:MAG: hypothetical protein WKG01_23755 [Kofleriaceae bacterium]